MEAGVVAPAHTAIFMPMTTMSKENICYVKNFMESDDFFGFDIKYGVFRGNSISDALWLCARSIMRCGYKLQLSNIVLFTNEAEPLVAGSQEFQKCLVRANDLRELGVYLMVVPMDDAFEFDPFYKELICTINDKDPETWRAPDPASLREGLQNKVFERDARRSCLRYFNLTLGPNLQISCGLHSFTCSTSLPKVVHLLRETNQVVISKRSYYITEAPRDDMSDAVTRALLPGELRKYQDIGGRKICFTPEELATTKSMIAPGMKLLGFKPIDQLPVRCYIKGSRFLYPNDSEIKGSSRLFRALWERCILQRKYALCVFAQVRKVAPR